MYAMNHRLYGGIWLLISGRNLTEPEQVRSASSQPGDIRAFAS